MIEKLKSGFKFYGPALILASLGYLLFLNIQPALTYSFSGLFDGNEYLKIYHYFRSVTPDFTVKFPYHSRVLVPFLASLFPFDDLGNFHTVNYLFMVLSVFQVLYVWNFLKLPWYLSAAGFFWLTLHWAGLIRLNIYDPITVDVPLYFLQALFLWAVLQKRMFFMLVTVVCFTFLKENIIPLVLVIFIYHVFLATKKESPPVFAVYYGIGLVSVILINLWLNYRFPPVEEGWNPVITVLFHLKETAENPFRIFHWFAALSMAFGPFIALFLIVKTRIKKTAEEEKTMILLSITCLVMSFTGGGDFTRLIFLGFPFIMTLILFSLKEIKPVFLLMALISGLPLMRITGTIPDPALYGWSEFYRWFPEFTTVFFTVLWIGYGILVAGLFWLVRKKLFTVN